MERLKNWFENVSEEVIAYLAAFILYVIAGAAVKLDMSELVRVMSWVASILMVYGIFIFLHPRIQLVWNTVVGKFFIAVITFVGTTFSFSLAEQAINYSLEVTSIPFVYTKSLVAMLAAPILILGGVAFVAMILTVCLMPLVFFEKVQLSLKGFISMVAHQGSNEPKGIGVIRLIALIILVMTCLSLLEKTSSYSEVVRDFTRWYAFNFETEVHTHCIVPEGTRVAYTGTAVIVTALHKEGIYEFSTTTCQQLTD